MNVYVYLCLFIYALIILKKLVSIKAGYYRCNYFTRIRRKEKKTCRWVYCCCNLDNKNSAWGLGGGVSLPADPGQRPGGGLSF